MEMQARKGCLQPTDWGTTEAWGGPEQVVWTQPVPRIDLQHTPVSFLFSICSIRVFSQTLATERPLKHPLQASGKHSLPAPIHFQSVGDSP